MHKKVVGKEGKKVMVSVKQPILLFCFDDGANRPVPCGDYLATWKINPYHPNRPSLVLVLDDLNVGGVEIYWDDPISKKQVTIADL